MKNYDKRNPEGHESFTNYCKRVYGILPDELEENGYDFDIIEAEWICKLK